MKANRLAYSISEACGLLSVGRTTLYSAIKRGDLKTCKAGRRTLITTLRRFSTGLRLYRILSRSTLNRAQQSKGPVMSKQRPPFNPSSFSDALTEKSYAQNSGKRKKLERKREKLVNWLRKKAKGVNEEVQELADMVENVPTQRTGANRGRAPSVPTRPSACLSRSPGDISREYRALPASLSCPRTAP